MLSRRGIGSQSTLAEDDSRRIKYTLSGIESEKRGLSAKDGSLNFGQNAEGVKEER